MSRKQPRSERVIATHEYVTVKHAVLSGQSILRRKQIDKALLKMIATYMQPASTVEDMGSQSLGTFTFTRLTVPAAQQENPHANDWWRSSRNLHRSRT